MLENQKRDFMFAAAGVGVSSAVMALVFYTAWTDIYWQVKAIEAQVETATPFLNSGALQIVAMAALGMYLTWSVLFALNIQKRYQGLLILGGSVVALLLLSALGIFLPNINLNAPNLLALLGGIVLGLISEISEFPWNDQPGDLRYISLEDSSWSGLVTLDGEPAQFPAAAKGLYGTIMLLVVGANIALIIGNTPIIGMALSFVASPIFGYFLLRLVDFENSLPEKSLQTAILGPSGSGKTLSLYGLYSAALDSDDLGQVQPSDKTNLLIETIEEGKDAILMGEDVEIRDEARNPFAEELKPDADWPVPSTDNLHMLGFSFPFGTFPKRVVSIQLTDHSGGLFGRLFRRTENDVATDGGPSEDDVNEQLPSVVKEQLEDDTVDNKSKEDEPSGAEESQPNSTEPSGAEESQPNSTEPSGAEESQPDSTDSDMGPNEQAKLLEQQIEEADKIIFLIDIKKLIQSDKSNQVSPAGVQQMIRICKKTNPNNVVLIATKADYAIESFQKAYNYENVEPDTGNSVVDYDEFTEFITEQLQNRKQGNIRSLMNLADANEIIPVYYKTEVKDGERVPRTSDADELFASENSLDGVGFDVALREIAGKR